MTSICSDPSRAPIVYHWFGSGMGSSPVAAFQTLIAHDLINDLNQRYLLTEFRSLMQRLQRGVLRPVDEVTRIKRASEVPLYELRINFEANAEGRHLYRIYHFEQSDLGSLVVGLHMHRKLIFGNRELTRLAQNLEIENAMRRFEFGREQNWGLPRG